MILCISEQIFQFCRTNRFSDFRSIVDPGSGKSSAFCGSRLDPGSVRVGSKVVPKRSKVFQGVPRTDCPQFHIDVRKHKRTWFGQAFRFLLNSPLVI